MLTMRLITTKQVQTHFSCVCGYNVVDHEPMRVRWKDLPLIGVVRRKDRQTGKPFLLQRIIATECKCYE